MIFKLLKKCKKKENTWKIKKQNFKTEKNRKQNKWENKWRGKEEKQGKRSCSTELDKTKDFQTRSKQARTRCCWSCKSSIMYIFLSFLSWFCLLFKVNNCIVKWRMGAWDMHRVRQKWKDEVALWASCYLRLLARRSEELAHN